MSKFHYELHNFVDGDEYVNIDSDVSDFNRVWTTQVPYNYIPVDSEQPTKPFRFNKRADALWLLDIIKSNRLTDWSNNMITYMRMNVKKPVWKVYKVISQPQ